ncbi:hypothetical protein GCM10009347_41890 [Shewanella algicola]|nr:hypothetical protein GCM10009347_41890 [Shewanella algicola]
MSSLQGGKFGHGFISAGLMKGLGKNETSATLGRTMIQAIAGGTISRLTGGKFSNGEVNAAIQYLVNETSKTLKERYNENIKKAVNFVNNALAKGLVQPPTDKMYQVKSVTYSEELYSDEGKSAHGLFIPIPVRGWDPLSAKIQISALGAETIESAIVTYGHELGHFDYNRSEASAEVYGKQFLKLYQGN